MLLCVERLNRSAFCQSTAHVLIIIIIIIIDLELEIQRMWHMKTVVIPVVVGALGTVKKGMVENIKKVSERATARELLHESSERFSVYEQND